jgi:hypothetical protein
MLFSILKKVKKPKTKRNFLESKRKKNKGQEDPKRKDSKKKIEKRNEKKRYSNPGENP